MKNILAYATLACAALAHAQTQDPYLWLEDVTGERALAWVQEQNTKSRPAVEAQGDFKATLERFTAIANSRDRIPSVTQLGSHLYNFWQDAGSPRGVWRRTTHAEYRKAAPAWETVLDMDALGAAEKLNWVWKGAQCLAPRYERCMVNLSRGGGDAVELREFDTTKKAWVDGGFRLPESKGGVAWIDENTLYAARDFGAGTLTRSGYARQVRRLARDQALADAPVVFEVGEADVGAWPAVNQENGYRTEWVTRSVSVRVAEISVLRDGRFVRLQTPASAEVRIAARELFVRLREPWKPAAVEHPAGTLLVIDLEHFMRGERNFEVLFTPGPRTALDSFTPLKTMVLLDVLDNVQSRIFELSRSTTGARSSREVATPRLSNINVVALDRRESDDYLMTVTGFTTPTTLYFARGGSDRLDRVKALPAFYDAAGLAVTQHEAVSKDGTRIPYFQVMRAEAKADGSHPTVMLGYGGFEVSQLPFYSANIGVGWLEKRGVFVLANLRGGGEFGPQWHRSAQRDGRQKAHDDFAAVAEDLIKRRVTSPARLGIFGGSQGGLLVGATLLQRPELFGAAVATVPLMDMRRYHKLPPGASWMGEYGDPDKPEDWAFISNYSPYQIARKDTKVPPWLITTSTRDDRVHPGHARKMAALMQSLGHPTSYFEYTEGGHGSGTTPAQVAYTQAFIFAYFRQQLMR